MHNIINAKAHLDRADKALENAIASEVAAARYRHSVAGENVHVRAQAAARWSEANCHRLDCERWRDRCLNEYRRIASEVRISKM